MNINPSNGIKFNKEELLGLFLNTIDDIIKRDNEVICYIKCYTDKLNAGANMSIRRIKALDNNIYLMFDLDVIGSEKIKKSINHGRGGGPIIIEPNSEMLKIACESLIGSIITTQDVCFTSNNKMQLSFNIETNDNNFNVIKGSIKDIKNINQEVFEMINTNNSKYMEVEFTLEEPRMTHLLYIYTIRDKHLDIPIYIINVVGNSTCNIVTIREDFNTIFNGWVNEIYRIFKMSSADPAVMVKYYSLSEKGELI